jgi:hypothetical protein
MLKNYSVRLVISLLIIANSLVTLTYSNFVLSPISNNAFAQKITASQSWDARGEISSLVLNGPMDKSVLTGDWSIEVRGANVTEFSANITRIWINGTEIKSYQVENFRQLPYESVDLDGNISASFGGVSDIKLDNEFMWENVSTTIAINHSLAMSLTLDDNATDNQFAAQPIYGLVNRLVERKEMRFE